MESFVVGAVVSMKILYKSLDKFGIGIIYFCQVFYFVNQLSQLVRLHLQLISLIPGALLQV